MNAKTLSSKKKKILKRSLRIKKNYHVFDHLIGDYSHLCNDLYSSLYSYFETQTKFIQLETNS